MALSLFSYVKFRKYRYSYVPLLPELQFQLMLIICLK